MLDQVTGNQLDTDSHTFTCKSNAGTQSGDGDTQSSDSGYQSDDVNVLPRAIRASRDRFYQQGPNGPVIVREEITFDLQLVDHPSVSVATLKLDTVTYNLADELAQLIFNKFGYESDSVQPKVYSIESSSAADFSSYDNGKKFEFTLNIAGHTYQYEHDIPTESEYLLSRVYPSITIVLGMLIKQTRTIPRFPKLKIMPLHGRIHFRHLTLTIL